MGIFSRRPRGMTPAEEAARRRQSHIPEGVGRPQSAPAAHRPSSNVAGGGYETKTLTFPQVGLMGRTNVDAKLAPFIADGWEVVTDDRKRYGVGGKHTVLIRRPRG